jgi:hypothetical protein
MADVYCAGFLPVLGVAWQICIGRGMFTPRVWALNRLSMSGECAHGIVAQRKNN